MRWVAAFGMARMCSPRMMAREPVAVTKMCPCEAASSMVVTWNPSMAACKALIGSISVTMTRAPYRCIEWAHPLPTSP